MGKEKLKVERLNSSFELPNKILCVGDIHAKAWIPHAVEPLINDYDAVYFLGDYVDDWGASPVASAEALAAVIDLGKKYKNVVLLRGNHDFSEYYGYEKRAFMCSGFNEGTHELCHEMFDAYWDNMQTTEWLILPDRHDYIISHAGLVNGWLRRWMAEGKWLFSLAETEEFMYEAGYGRGGTAIYPSPIWADASELKVSPVPGCDQIVGHTPVKTVTCHEFTNGNGTKNRLFFCDTFSTTRDGEPIGDGSCLSLNLLTGEWDKVYLERERS